MQKACEIKKSNPNMTTTQIGKIIGRGYGTIRNYLKIGNLLGWIRYDAKEEKSKSRKLSSMSVEIFKNGISLGVFQSVSELSRQSLELFGVKLIRQGISAVCSGKRHKYKGFTFIYI